MTRQWSNDSLITRFRKKMLSGVNFKWVGMKNRWRRRSWDFFRFTCGHNNWTCAKLSFLLMWFSLFFILNGSNTGREKRPIEEKNIAQQPETKWPEAKWRARHMIRLVLFHWWCSKSEYILVSYQRGVVMNLISFMCICWSTYATRTDVTGNKNAFNKIGCLKCWNLKIENSQRNTRWFHELQKRAVIVSECYKMCFR